MTEFTLGNISKSQEEEISSRSGQIIFMPSDHSSKSKGDLENNSSIISLSTKKNIIENTDKEIYNSKDLNNLIKKQTKFGNTYSFLTKNGEPYFLIGPCCKFLFFS